MTINKNFVSSSLLQHNYLPAQRRKKEELPPDFSSVLFTPLVAEKIAKLPMPKDVTRGFDTVEYRSTKFTNVSRALSIPHPMGYSTLVKCIVENWTAIEPLLNSPVSMIKPRAHADGRLIVMDYDKGSTRPRRARHQAFGQRFVARTDITNCFPALYTHAIPWAVVGIAAAKKDFKSGWHNALDAAARRTTRDETQGVPVGPGTSNIIAELILSAVDRKLAPEFPLENAANCGGVSRFIDDYTYYCDSHDKAQLFLRRLEEELGNFKLRLNPRKTSITQPTTPFGQAWSIDLTARLPQSAEVDTYAAINYLEYACCVANDHPDGSVHKYAVVALLSRALTARAKYAVLDYLLVLAFSHPVLLPVLSELISDTTFLFDGVSHPSRYNVILRECANLHRSDGMAWTLHYVTKYQLSVEQNVVESVLNTGDCISILMLYRDTRFSAIVLAWVKARDWSDGYERDRYWLLLYQLFVDGHVGADMATVPDAFKIMQTDNVRFVTS